MKKDQQTNEENTKPKTKWYNEENRAPAMESKEVFKFAVWRIQAFIDSFPKEQRVTQTAITYAMYAGKIDYVLLGKEKIVVGTPKTMAWLPNTNKNRGRRRKK